MSAIAKKPVDALAKPRVAPARDRLLDAAAELAVHRGAGELTLDAVAEAAGVSKGGLLYHFPTKDALLTAMVARMVARFEAEHAEALAREPEGVPGRWTRAFVESFFSVPPEEMAERHRTCGALLATVASNPRLLDPVRQAYKNWRQETQRDGLAPEQTLLALAAVDALIFWQLYDMWQPPAEEVAAMHRLLREICSKPFVSRNGASAKAAHSPH